MHCQATSVKYFPYLYFAEDFRCSGQTIYHCYLEVNLIVIFFTARRKHCSHVIFRSVGYYSVQTIVSFVVKLICQRCVGILKKEVKANWRRFV